MTALPPTGAADGVDEFHLVVSPAAG